MITEIIGGALLSKVLTGKQEIKPIKNSSKRYVVACINKGNAIGGEIANVVFITSDKEEALTWAETAVDSLKSIIQVDATIGTNNQSGIIADYYIKTDEYIIAYIVFEY